MSYIKFNSKQFKMKNLQITLKPLIFLLAISISVTNCSSDDSVEQGPSSDNLPPIELDCDYFSSGNIHLENVPGAPVDYIISCDPKIKGDILIDPGVVIAFEKNAGLQFIEDENYKIEMNGTAQDPIILTGTEDVKGHWRGLLMTSDNPSNIMQHVTVEYAGQIRPGGWNYRGAVIGSWGAVMNFESCNIQDSQEIGLHWVGYASTLNISNSTFTRNDVPIVTNPNFINSIDETSTYQGNVNDYIQLEHVDVNTDITFHNIDIPFFSKGFGPKNDATRKFTFDPGVTLIMDAGSEISISNSDHQHAVIMVGTANDRITIKGKESVPGYWNGIDIQSDSPLNEIGYLDISDAGDAIGYPNGAIKLGYNDYLNIHDVNFINCTEYGMSINYYFNYSFHLEYNNLTLDNTPKLFSNWEGAEVVDPFNP